MKFLVAGCSYTKGHGLLLEKNDPMLWVNQLIRHVYPAAEIVNVAKSGIGNNMIFKSAAKKLTAANFDYTIIGWSQLSRLDFVLGLELYGTELTLGRDWDTEIHLNPDIILNKKYFDKLSNEFLRYYNDHWSLLDLLTYTNVLTKLTDNKICFVNSLIDISKNYFQKKKIDQPSELSEFEQNILSVHTRTDENIKKLYNKIHEDYSDAGGIDETKWLNLYDPLIKMQIDYVEDNYHPGYKSQEVFFQKLLEKFVTNLNAS